MRFEGIIRITQSDRNERELSMVHRAASPHPIMKPDQPNRLHHSLQCQKNGHYLQPKDDVRLINFCNMPYRHDLSHAQYEHKINKLANSRTMLAITLKDFADEAEGSGLHGPRQRLAVRATVYNNHALSMIIIPLTSRYFCVMLRNDPPVGCPFRMLMTPVAMWVVVLFPSHNHCARAAYSFL